MFTVYSELLNEPLGLFDCIEDAEEWILESWSSEDAIITESDADETMGHRLNTYGA